MDPGSGELGKVHCLQQSFVVVTPTSQTRTQVRTTDGWRGCVGALVQGEGSPSGRPSREGGKLFTGKPRLAGISFRWRKSNQQSTWQGTVMGQDKKPPLLPESPPSSARVSSEHARPSKLSLRHLRAPEPL